MDFIIHSEVKIQQYIKTGALFLALLFLSGCSGNESYSITFGGDIMLARGGAPIVTDWQSIDLSLPSDLANSDGQNFYAAAFESPLTEDYSTLTNSADYDMNLCAGAKLLPLIANSGFDILSFNNNHQNDCNEHGASETQRILEKAGFSSFRENDGLWVANFAQQKFVIISVDEVSAPVNNDALIKVIRDEKQNDNFVVVSSHWGNEYQAGPDDRQQGLAQNWVDAGADVIWGHHPHVLQRIDWMTSNEDKHTALVMFSLGNLMADQFMLQETQRSALVRVEIENGRIVGIILIPVKFNWQARSLDFDLEKSESTSILDRLNLDSDRSIPVDVYSMEH